MPKAIIDMVRTALTLFDLIALNATLTFSANNVIQFNRLPPAFIKGTKIHLLLITGKRLPKNEILIYIFNKLVVYLIF